MAAAVAFGIRRYGPACPLGWWLLVGFGILDAAGCLDYYVITEVLGQNPYPSHADAFWLTGTAVLLAGTFFLSREAGSKHFASVIDALIVTVGVGLVYWIFLILPYFHAPDLSAISRAVSMGYPGLELMMFWMVMRVAFQRGNREAALRLMAAGLAVLWVNDCVLSAINLHGAASEEQVRLFDIPMAFGRLCLAGAALHPSMKLLGARSSETPSRGVAGSRRRLAVLAGASLLAPGVLLEQYVTGQSADIPVIATSSALLFLLVVARMGNLLQVQAEMNRQLDESLRKLHQVDQELRHAQKLEAIGKLAGGIAHEINTPIQFIGDNVRFLGTSFSTLEKLATGRRQTNGQVGGRGAVDEEVEFLVEEVPRAIRETLEGVERVATIVGAMKAFGHPGDGQQADVDLNEALRNAVTVARSELRAVAEVDFELGDLPLVRCFPADLNQVLLNLIVNAAHAVAETGRPGRLGLATRVEGDEVVVAISDTGVGIPEEIRDRVFEPFFTTKAVGEGTGQGLSLVWTLVVERHHGTVSFTSQRDVGTTFTIRLPLAGVREDELAAAS